MFRWLVGLTVAGVTFGAAPVLAQSPIQLTSVQVQLWPEYDQPSMLVIIDFQVAAGTQLPVGVTVRFPKDANLIAVAVQGADRSLMNADYLEARGDDASQSVIVQIQTPSTYRIEYYQPYSRTGNRREFTYQWDSDYQVQDLVTTIRLPADATAVSTTPTMHSATTADGSPALDNDFGSVNAGAPLSVMLAYTRNSDTLAAPLQELQPSTPLSGSTPGRVMLGNYLPYILGALGVVLIIGGGIYFWQSNHSDAAPRQRHGSRTGDRGGDNAVIYCPQCGTRAQRGDRFCRVCGTRLRTPE